MPLDERPWVVAVVAAAPLLYIALACLAKLVAPGGYMALVLEDGPVEWATLAAYMVACGFALHLALRLRRDSRVFSVLYGLLALGLFLVAMEEISWGQRVFGIETPAALGADNIKGELNFHNHRMFPLELTFAVVGFYGAFARFLVPPGVKSRFPVATDLLTPPPALFFYFVFTFVLFGYYYVMVTVHGPVLAEAMLTWRSPLWEGRFIIGKDQEAMELLLAGGFLMFALRNWYRYRAGLPAPARRPAGGRRGPGMGPASRQT